MSARTIVNMANQAYSHHQLLTLDDHTLTCKAEGITYFPIPPGNGSNYAGLMSVDVPPVGRKGQIFKVVTRQITNAFALVPDRKPRPGSLSRLDRLRHATYQMAQSGGVLSSEHSCSNQKSIAGTRRAAALRVALDR